MLKRTLLGLTAATLIALPLISSANAETYGEEMREHPRIAKAIHELEDAIAYMEAAPHDFGGHKGAAIRDSRAALVQLREAIKYREHHDHH